METRTKLTLKLIKPDPLNPRQEFDPVELKKLEDSIKTNGVLNPLIVEKTSSDVYLLIDGERRYRASTRAGLKEVPVIVLEPMSEIERLIKRFHIQEQHAEWTAWEKAKAIQSLQSYMNLSVKELASVMGVSNSHMEKYLLIGILSKRVATNISQRKLPFDWVIELARMIKCLSDHEELRDKLEDAIIDKVDSKVISASKELRKYRIAVMKKGLPIIKKIIENPKYTPTQAVKDADAQIDIHLQSMYGSASFIISHGAVILEESGKSKIEIPDRTFAMFKRARKTLDELLKLE